MKEAYLIIDVGTGNLRVAITGTQGNIIHLERDNVHYVRDDKYPDALYFDPNQLWLQIENLIRKSLAEVKDTIKIIAITASSQREGIVILNKEGKSILGLPNHDHRGREWEDIVEDKDYVYSITGRYPGSLFSAMKLLGIRQKRPEVYSKIATVLSISDWVQFELCGVAGYEHAQASETILYDVENKKWSQKLCAIFDIDPDILPPLNASGTILGPIKREVTSTLNLPAEAVVIVGGSDTQLAIKSTGAAVNDYIIISGTTTPVTVITDIYITDEKQRTWTNRYVDDKHFILETNAGVTGLNYQRLKKIFYPNDSYDLIEEEMVSINPTSCIASLGSLIADEKKPMLQGGFIFSTPVSAELSRADFMLATLWDMACCIKINFEILEKVSGKTSDFIWVCGGGFQSKTLRQFIATLIGKPLKIQQGFQQASVVGGAAICSEALNNEIVFQDAVDSVFPDLVDYDVSFHVWKQLRLQLQNNREI
jgi:autoinducer 2 (AI-2) kinase